MRKVFVRRASPEDRNAFLAWAAGVESWFGPMVGVPEFEAALDAALSTPGAAFVAGEESGRPLGGVLLALEAREIGWLVVAPEGRGAGAGAALLEAALAELGPGAVRVETFADGVEAGIPARRLYARFGFGPTGESGRTPVGVPTQVLARGC
jgi:GNAT superfamily N-acetyltransferase